MMTKKAFPLLLAMTMSSAFCVAQSANSELPEVPVPDSVRVELQNLNPEKGSITLFVSAAKASDFRQFGMRDVPFVETNIWNPDCTCRDD